MKTAGLFFLRGRPCSVRFDSPTDGSVPGWAFRLVERHSQRGVQQLTAYWRGPAADQFIQAHASLKAGDALTLEIDRLHAIGNEIAGFVERCEVAPSRWPAPSANDQGARA